MTKCKTTFSRGNSASVDVDRSSFQNVFFFLITPVDMMSDWQATMSTLSAIAGLDVSLGCIFYSVPLLTDLI
jgi:hypothetical protein